MCKATWIGMAFLAVLTAGCGGSGGGDNGSGQVSGRVTDINGNVISGAKVHVDGLSAWTSSNSNGRYVLDAVPDQDEQIDASITLSGTTYVGSNLARVYNGTRAKNVDIVVVPESATAAVHAVVYDNQGYLLENAKVFAIPTNAGIYTSALAVTNRDGECWIPNLMSGQNYSLMASGGGYQSSPDNVSLSSGETRDINFTLGNASNVFLAPPANVAAKSWTTPSETTRSPGSRGVYEAIKNRLDPKRSLRKAVTRSTSAGNNIEVDLFWDPMATTDPGNANKLLGYGIYRGLGSSVTTSYVDYLRDPLASFYSDLDDMLVEGQTYTYQMTSLNTTFPGSSGSESSKSAAVTASTLGDLTLSAVQRNPVSFSWSSAIGATEYTVYLYDQYPSVSNMSPIWTSATSAFTQATYTGAALVSGHVYFYYVVGDNGSNGYTISVIDSFTAN